MIRLRYILAALGLGVAAAGVLQRLKHYEPEARREGESLRAFRFRILDRRLRDLPEPETEIDGPDWHRRAA